MTLEYDIIMLLFESGGIFGTVLGIILLVLFQFGPKIIMFFMKREMIHPGPIYRPDEILKSKISYWKNIKVNALKIENPCKRMIVQDFLKIKLDIIEKEIKKIDVLTKTEEFMKMTPDEVYRKLLEIISSISEDYQNRAIEEGIPKMFLDKYFYWRKFYVDFFCCSAEAICNCSLYDDNKERFYALCMFYTATFEASIINIEKTISELNGDLDPIVYKGEPCKKT